VKEVKPDNVITAADVADAPVNPTVMVEAVEMTLLENATEADVKAPAIDPLSTNCQYWSLAVENPILCQLPPMATPIVRPISVMVTSEPPGIGVPKYWHTNSVSIDIGQVSTLKVEPGIEIAAVGLLEVVAKKASRHASLMMLASPISPPAEDLNENVADTPVLPATRSILANLKGSPGRLTLTPI
jgi:hypothetical protein